MAADCIFSKQPLDYRLFVPQAFMSCRLIAIKTRTPSVKSESYCADTPWSRLTQYVYGLTEPVSGNPRLLLSTASIDGETLFVCFRESASLADWQDNLTAWGSLSQLILSVDHHIAGQVHNGFDQRARLLPLDAFYDLLKTGMKIIFTGFSQGSAVAELAFTQLINSDRWDHLWSSQVLFIGFASPLVSNSDFAEEMIHEVPLPDHTFTYGDLIHHFVYREDIVPRALTLVSHLNKTAQSSLASGFEFLGQLSLGLSVAEQCLPFLKSLSQTLINNIVPDYSPTGWYHHLSGKGNMTDYNCSDPQQRERLISMVLFRPDEVNILHLQHHAPDRYRDSLTTVPSFIFPSRTEIPTIPSRLNIFDIKPIKKKCSLMPDGTLQLELQGRNLSFLSLDSQILSETCSATMDNLVLQCVSSDAYNLVTINSFSNPPSIQLVLRSILSQSEMLYEDIRVHPRTIKDHIKRMQPWRLVFLASTHLAMAGREPETSSINVLSLPAIKDLSRHLCALDQLMILEEEFKYIACWIAWRFISLPNVSSYHNNSFERQLTDLTTSVFSSFWLHFSSIVNPSLFRTWLEHLKLSVEDRLPIDPSSPEDRAVASNIAYTNFSSDDLPFFNPAMKFKSEAKISWYHNISKLNQGLAQDRQQFLLDYLQENGPPPFISFSELFCEPHSISSPITVSLSLLPAQIYFMMNMMTNQLASPSFRSRLRAAIFAAGFIPIGLARAMVSPFLTILPLVSIARGKFTVQNPLTDPLVTMSKQLQLNINELLKPVHTCLNYFQSLRLDLDSQRITQDDTDSFCACALEDQLLSYIHRRGGLKNCSNLHVFSKQVFRFANIRQYFLQNSLIVISGFQKNGKSWLARLVFGSPSVGNSIENTRDLTLWNLGSCKSIFVVDTPAIDDLSFVNNLLVRLLWESAHLGIWLSDCVSMNSETHIQEFSNYLSSECSSATLFLATMADKMIPHILCPFPSKKDPGDAWDDDPFQDTTPIDLNLQNQFSHIISSKLNEFPVNIRRVFWLVSVRPEVDIPSVLIPKIDQDLNLLPIGNVPRDSDRTTKILLPRSLLALTLDLLLSSGIQPDKIELLHEPYWSAFNLILAQYWYTDSPSDSSGKGKLHVIGTMLGGPIEFRKLKARVSSSASLSSVSHQLSSSSSSS